MTQTRHILKGDKVRSKELPCLGVGTALCDSSYGRHAAYDPLDIVTVCWSQDPHGHLPEDHTPLEDWDLSDLEIVE